MTFVVKSGLIISDIIMNSKAVTSSVWLQRGSDVSSDQRLRVIGHTLYHVTVMNHDGGVRQRLARKPPTTTVEI